MEMSVIIFNFDSIIFKSVSVKIEAFRMLFSFFPEYVEMIMQFHLDNDSKLWFYKFRYIHYNIFKEGFTQKKFIDQSEKIADTIFEVIKAAFNPSSHVFIKTYHAKIPSNIVSATPEENLQKIIQKKGLSHYFRIVYGAPRKKGTFIREIIKHGGCSLDSIIIIKDAQNNFEALRLAGILLIGREKPRNKSRFHGLTGIDTLISDLHELTRYNEVHK